MSGSTIDYEKALASQLGNIQKDKGQTKKELEGNLRFYRILFTIFSLYMSKNERGDTLMDNIITISTSVLPLLKENVSDETVADAVNQFKTIDPSFSDFFSNLGGNTAVEEALRISNACLKRKSQLLSANNFGQRLSRSSFGRR